jgi:ATP/maltotriose-dependent transcriptional regulator MalT
MANRHDVTERLEHMLTGRSPKRILLLSAASSSGKTHLLAELKVYAKRLHIAHASLDCKGDLSLEDLVDLIALDLKKFLVTTPSATGNMRRIGLISDLQQLSQPLLLTFDTYEQASAPAKNWIENQLLPRLDGSTDVTVRRFG